MSKSDPRQKNYTPINVVRQGLMWWRDREPLLRHSVHNILDPSAGSGAFGVVFDELWPRANTFALEVRPEELDNLKEVYSEAHTCKFPDDVPDLPDYCELVATNPPFPLWREFVEYSMDYLDDNGSVLLLGLDSWGSRSIDGHDFFEVCPPTAQARIAGTVSFRGPGEGADTRSYSWWLWDKARLGVVHRDEQGLVVWPTVNLPRLPGEARRWSHPPGTMDPTP